MVGWHHQINGHEFEQTQGDSEGQERLVCCSPWGHKESDMTELLNNNNWNKLGPDGQYKFYSVNVDYSKLKKEGPDVYMKHFTMKLLRMKVFQKTFAQFST